MENLNQNKFFFIGLHKTGTSSINFFCRKKRFKATNSTNWINDEYMLNAFQVFTDGGSHFDGQNEFDFKYLDQKFPDAKFIMQTRKVKTWIISKLRHTKTWNNDKIEIEEFSKEKVLHDNWKLKIWKFIDLFIKHKYNYENKVIDYFLHQKRYNEDKFIVIDITENNNNDVDRLCNLLGVGKSSSKFPHINSSIKKPDLPNNVINYVEKCISRIKNDRKIKRKICLAQRKA